MTEWRIPAAIDAIVAALKTNPGLTVWDGPIVTGEYSDAVYIGYDAHPDGTEQYASDTTQSWAGLGQRARDEDSTITCAIVSLYGSGDSWKPVRDAISAMLDLVGQTLRGYSNVGPSLGLSPPSVAEIIPGQYFQEPLAENGFQGRLTFTIHYKTRV